MFMFTINVEYEVFPSPSCLLELSSLEYLANYMESAHP